MDFSSYNHTIVMFLAFLVILYGFYRLLPKNKKHYKNISKIPQPSGALPLIGHLYLLGGQVPVFRKLAAMADKYGPIYSLKLGCRRLLVVSNWEIVKDCFTTNDRILATRPSIAAGRFMGYNNAIFALAPYGQYWREMRKIATVELLSSHRLELLKHVRFSEVNAFIKDLSVICAQKNAEYSITTPKVIMINKFIEHLTFNIVLRMIVGKQFSSENYGQKNSEAWRYKRAIQQAVYLSGVFVLSDAIPSLEWLDIQGHLSSMKEVAKELDTIIANWVEEHLQKRLKGTQNDCEASDFMDVMLSILPEDAVISGHRRDTIIKATALILTLTGAESTGITVTWALSLLLNNPSTLKAAQEELDKNVGKSKWVEESDINNLKYLQAIVKETLRLYPPAPMTGPREAMEDCYINGYLVPKGTRLIVNIWKLHRDPQVWKNPNEFQPERFLTSNAHLDFKSQNCEYIPFSSGRRSCPGYNFGLQVVYLTLARLLQGFDVETIGGKPVDMEEGLGTSLPKVNPVEVVLTPRLQSEFYQCL